MIIRKCDKCGKTLNNKYWVISTHQQNKFMEVFSLNDEAHYSIKNKTTEYCEECMNEICNFIQKGKEK